MFSFRPDVIPNNILVVGCGGTGSRLVPLLVQFIRSITKEYTPSGWLGTTNIILADADTVEQKNLARQLFVTSDVGKNKAQVLATRYGKAYGMNVMAYPKFIEHEALIDIRETLGINLTHGATMVIMCVDSAEARRKVLDATVSINNGNPTVYIDAGNEDSFGQVRMFHPVFLIDERFFSEEEFKATYKNPERIEYVPEPLPYIPMDLRFYQELQDNPGLGSCADLDQTLAINALMSTFIMSFVQNHYYNKVIDYNEISVDIVKGSVAYSKNTVVNYRNKAIATNRPSAKAVPSASLYRLYRYGRKVQAGEVLGDFLRNNALELAALIAAQNAVTEEVVMVEPASKALTKRKKSSSLATPEPVISVVTPLESPIFFNGLPTGL